MSLDSGHTVSKHGNDGWEDSFVEVFLELFSHIIRDLSNAMDGSISDFRYWVLAVLNDSRDHWSDLID